MKQSTLNSLKLGKISKSPTGTLLNYVLADETVPEGSKRAIEEDSRSGVSHDEIISNILSGANITAQDEAPINESLAQEQQQARENTTIPMAESALKTGVPIAAGIAGTMMGPISGMGAAARLGPQLAGGLDYALGSLLGRAGTGQSPVSPEAGADVAAAVLPPAAALGVSKLPGALGGLVARLMAAGAGGVGAAELGSRMTTGQPASTFSRIAGGVGGSAGQGLDELAMGLRPKTSEIQAVKNIEAQAPLTRGKISSVLAAPSNDPRLGFLEAAGTDPFVVNPEVEGNIRALDLGVKQVSSKGLPIPSKDTLEQITEMVRSGKVTDEVSKSETFQRAMSAALSQKRGAVEAQFGAALEPFKQMNAPHPQTGDLLQSLSDLTAQFSVDPAFATSPSMQKVNKLLNKVDLTPAEIVQVAQELRPSGSRTQARFNEEARYVIADWLDKSFPGEASDLRAAKSTYRQYAQNRDVIEGTVDKGVMKPEVWAKNLQAGTVPAQSERQVMSYFGSDPEFQRVSKQLTGQLPTDTTLKLGFKDTDDLLKSAIDPDAPDRAERAWRLLDQYLPDPKDRVAIAAQFNSQMLTDTKGVPDVSSFLRRFEALPVAAAQKIYGPNYPNVRKFVTDITPLAESLDQIKTQYAQPYGSRLRQGFSLGNFAEALPMRALAGSSVLGGVAGAIRPLTSLLSTAAFVLGPSVLGKLILSNSQRAVDLVRGIVNAVKVTGTREAAKTGNGE